MIRPFHFLCVAALGANKNRRHTTERVHILKNRKKRPREDRANTLFCSNDVEKTAKTHIQQEKRKILAPVLLQSESTVCVC